MRLESLSPSTSGFKKLKAVFRLDNGRTKTIHFGDRRYEDFTTHKDIHRRDRYIERHEAREDFDNPLTAGALSRWILWNKSTLNASIRDYRRRFGL